MPAWTFRQAKSLDLCGLQRAGTGQVISYPSETQKCCSIVPRDIEKAGKRFLTSYPLSVTACLPAVKLVCFQTFLIGGCPMAAGPPFVWGCRRLRRRPVFWQFPCASFLKKPMRKCSVFFKRALLFPTGQWSHRAWPAPAPPVSQCSRDNSTTFHSQGQRSRRSLPCAGRFPPQSRRAARSCPWWSRPS